MNINKYFDKIYVTTIKQNTERHDYIKNLFSKYNIVNYEFFYGIEGEKLDVNKLLKEKKIHNNMSKLPNFVGNILNHKDAWQHMIDNNFNKCVFFEDDVFFVDEFLKNFDNFMNNLPNDWGVIQFACLPPNFRSKEDKKINDYVIKRWSLVAGAHFYAINKRSAKILIDNFYPIKKGIDGYLGDMTNPWIKEIGPESWQKGINLIGYCPTKCFAVDCSHNNGQNVKFKSRGLL